MRMFSYFDLFLQSSLLCFVACKGNFYHRAHCFDLMQAISSSLGANLSSYTAGEVYSSGSNARVNIDHIGMCFLEEDMDVPEIVEEIIDLLLTGLRDSVCSYPDIMM